MGSENLERELEGVVAVGLGADDHDFVAALEEAVLEVEPGGPRVTHVGGGHAVVWGQPRHDYRVGIRSAHRPYGEYCWPGMARLAVPGARQEESVERMAHRVDAWVETYKKAMLKPVILALVANRKQTTVATLTERGLYRTIIGSGIARGDPGQTG